MQLDLDFIAIIKKGERFNLIVNTSENEYFNNGEIQYKYKSSDYIIKQCLQMLISNDNINSKRLIDLYTLTHFINDNKNYFLKITRF